MIKNNLPFIGESEPMSKVIVRMTEGRLGLAIIHKDKYLIGIITDGDLRRVIQGEIDLNSVKASEVMTLNPPKINENEKLIDAKNKMLEAKVQALVVVNTQNKITGIIQIY